MEEKPISITRVRVTPASKAGSDSGNRTLKITWRISPPMDRMASIRPLSTSSRAFSTIRAKNGKAPMVIGTTAAVLPRVVPTISRVSGIRAISITTNGNDRPRLTSALRPPCRRGSGYRPWRRLMNSRTPRGRPINKVKSPASSTMYRVSPVALSNSWKISFQSMVRVITGPTSSVGCAPHRRSAAAGPVAASAPGPSPDRPANAPAYRTPAAVPGPGKRRGRRSIG